MSGFNFANDIELVLIDLNASDDSEGLANEAMIIPG